jgi:folate-binding protein YgfZ
MTAGAMRPVIADQSEWGQLRVTGADRARFLQGMTTNDVAGLAEGAWCRAAILNAKGRVLAVVDVVHDGDAFVVLTEPITAGKVREVLERHAIMDDVAFTPIQRAVHRVWDTPAAVWTAAPVFAAAAPSPPEEVEARRIEAGLPKYGVDVSEEYFPFEANLDAAISFQKGCYIGQEVVARANARGHANKRLVGLALTGDGPAAPGTPVSSEARPDAGLVTSSIVSPTFGPIALAYLHRSSWDPGTPVSRPSRPAIVKPLPF